MTGVVKRGSYSYASGDTGIRGDAEVAESTNGSVRIELTLDGQLYGVVTLHHTMWAQIVRDFPGPVDVSAIIAELRALPAPPDGASSTIESWYNGYVAALDALEEKLTTP